MEHVRVGRERRRVGGHGPQVRRDGARRALDIFDAGRVVLALDPAGASFCLGSVAVPPSDTPVGRFAVLSDPQGASFAVIVLADPSGGGGPDGT